MDLPIAFLFVMIPYPFMMDGLCQQKGHSFFLQCLLACVFRGTMIQYLHKEGEKPSFLADPLLV